MLALLLASSIHIGALVERYFPAPRSAGLIAGMLLASENKPQAHPLRRMAAYAIAHADSATADSVRVIVRRAHHDLDQWGR